MYVTVPKSRAISSVFGHHFSIFVSKLKIHSNVTGTIA